MKWLVDGFVVEWRNGRFHCSCGGARCRHIRAVWRWLKEKKQIVYVYAAPDNVSPRVHYIRLERGYLLYSIRPSIEYVEFTPEGPRLVVRRGRPVPLPALLSEIARPGA